MQSREQSLHSPVVKDGKAKNRMIVTEVGKSLLQDASLTVSRMEQEVTKVKSGRTLDLDGTQARVSVDRAKKPKMILLPHVKKDGSSVTNLKMLVDKRESVGNLNRERLILAVNNPFSTSQPTANQNNDAQKEKVPNASTSLSRSPSFDSPSKIKHNFSRTSQIVIPTSSLMRCTQEQTGKVFIPRQTKLVNLRVFKDEPSENMFKELSGDESVAFVAETPHGPHPQSKNSETPRRPQGHQKERTPQTAELSQVKIINELEEIGRQNQQYRTLRRLLEKKQEKKQDFYQAVHPDQSYQGFFKFVSKHSREGPFSRWESQHDPLLASKYTGLQAVKIGDFPIESLNMDHEFLKTSMSKLFEQEQRTKNKCIDLIKKTQLKKMELERRICC